MKQPSPITMRKDLSLVLAASGLSYQKVLINILKAVNKVSKSKKKLKMKNSRICLIRGPNHWCAISVVGNMAARVLLYI